MEYIFFAAIAFLACVAHAEETEETIQMFTLRDKDDPTMMTINVTNPGNIIARYDLKKFNGKDWDTIETNNKGVFNVKIDKSLLKVIASKADGFEMFEGTIGAKRSSLQIIVDEDSKGFTIQIDETVPSDTSLDVQYKLPNGEYTTVKTGTGSSVHVPFSLIADRPETLELRVIGTSNGKAVFDGTGEITFTTTTDSFQIVTEGNGFRININKKVPTDTTYEVQYERPDGSYEKVATTGTQNSINLPLDSFPPDIGKTKIKVIGTSGGDPVFTGSGQIEISRSSQHEMADSFQIVTEGNGFRININKEVPADTTYQVQYKREDESYETVETTGTQNSINVPLDAFPSSMEKVDIKVIGTSGGDPVFAGSGQIEISRTSGGAAGMNMYSEGHSFGPMTLGMGQPSASFMTTEEKVDSIVISIPQDTPDDTSLQVQYKKQDGTYQTVWTGTANKDHKIILPSDVIPKDQGDLELRVIGTSDGKVYGGSMTIDTSSSPKPPQIVQENNGLTMRADEELPADTQLHVQYQLQDGNYKTLATESGESIHVPYSAFPNDQNIFNIRLIGTSGNDQLYTSANVQLNLTRSTTNTGSDTNQNEQVKPDETPGKDDEYKNTLSNRIPVPKLSGVSQTDETLTINYTGGGDGIRHYLEVFDGKNWVVVGEGGANAVTVPLEKLTLIDGNVTLHIKAVDEDGDWILSEGQANFRMPLPGYGSATTQKPTTTTTTQKQTTTTTTQKPTTTTQKTTTTTTSTQKPTTTTTTEKPTTTTTSEKPSTTAQKPTTTTTTQKPTTTTTTQKPTTTMTMQKPTTTMTMQKPTTTMTMQKPTTTMTTQKPITTATTQKPTTTTTTQKPATTTTTQKPTTRTTTQKPTTTTTTQKPTTTTTTQKPTTTTTTQKPTTTTTTQKPTTTMTTEKPTTTTTTKKPITTTTTPKPTTTTATTTRKQTIKTTTTPTIKFTSPGNPNVEITGKTITLSYDPATYYNSGESYFVNPVKHYLQRQNEDGDWVDVKPAGPNEVTTTVEELNAEGTVQLRINAVVFEDSPQEDTRSSPEIELTVTKTTTETETDNENIGSIYENPVDRDIQCTGPGKINVTVNQNGKMLHLSYNPVAYINPQEQGQLQYYLEVKKDNQWNKFKEAQSTEVTVTLDELSNIGTVVVPVRIIAMVASDQSCKSPVLGIELGSVHTPKQQPRSIPTNVQDILKIINTILKKIVLPKAATPAPVQIINQPIIIGSNVNMPIGAVPSPQQQPLPSLKNNSPLRNILKSLGLHPGYEPSIPNGKNGPRRYVPVDITPYENGGYKRPMQYEPVKISPDQNNGYEPNKNFPNGNRGYEPSDYSKDQPSPYKNVPLEFDLPRGAVGYTVSSKNRGEPHYRPILTTDNLNECRQLRCKVTVPVPRNSNPAFQVTPRYEDNSASEPIRPQTDNPEFIGKVVTFENEEDANKYDVKVKDPDTGKTVKQEQFPADQICSRRTCNAFIGDLNPNVDYDYDIIPRKPLTSTPIKVEPMRLSDVLMFPKQNDANVYQVKGKDPETGYEHKETFDAESICQSDQCAAVLNEINPTSDTDVDMKSDIRPEPQSFVPQKALVIKKIPGMDFIDVIARDPQTGLEVEKNNVDVNSKQCYRTHCVVPMVNLDPDKKYNFDITPHKKPKRLEQLPFMLLNVQQFEPTGADSYKVEAQTPRNKETVSVNVDPKSDCNTKMCLAVIPGLDSRKEHNIKITDPENPSENIPNQSFFVAIFDEIKGVPAYDIKAIDENGAGPHQVLPKSKCFNLKCFAIIDQLEPDKEYAVMVTPQNPTDQAPHKKIFELDFDHNQNADSYEIEVTDKKTGETTKLDPIDPAMYCTDTKCEVPLGNIDSVKDHDFKVKPVVKKAEKKIGQQQFANIDLQSSSIDAKPSLKEVQFNEVEGAQSYDIVSTDKETGNTTVQAVHPPLDCDNSVCKVKLDRLAPNKDYDIEIKPQTSGIPLAVTVPLVVSFTPKDGVNNYKVEAKDKQLGTTIKKDIETSRRRCKGKHCFAAIRNIDPRIPYDVKVTADDTDEEIPNQRPRVMIVKFNEYPGAYKYSVEAKDLKNGEVSKKTLNSNSDCHHSRCVAIFDNLDPYRQYAVTVTPHVVNFDEPIPSDQAVTVKFDEVEGAKGYLVGVRDPFSGQRTSHTFGAKQICKDGECKATLPDLDPKKNYKDITVLPIGEVPVKPVEHETSEPTVVFDKVPGASSYEIEATDKETGEVTTTPVDPKSNCGRRKCRVEMGNILDPEKDYDIKVSPKEEDTLEIPTVIKFPQIPGLENHQLQIIDENGKQSLHQLDESKCDDSKCGLLIRELDIGKVEHVRLIPKAAKTFEAMSNDIIPVVVKFKPVENAVGYRVELKERDMDEDKTITNVVQLSECDTTECGKFVPEADGKKDYDVKVIPLFPKSFEPIQAGEAEEEEEPEEIPTVIKFPKIPGLEGYQLQVIDEDGKDSLHDVDESNCKDTQCGLLIAELDIGPVYHVRLIPKVTKKYEPVSNDIIPVVVKFKPVENAIGYRIELSDPDTDEEPITNSVRLSQCDATECAKLVREAVADKNYDIKVVPLFPKSYVPIEVKQSEEPTEPSTTTTEATTPSSTTETTTPSTTTEATTSSSTTKATTPSTTTEATTPTTTTEATTSSATTKATTSPSTTTTTQTTTTPSTTETTTPTTTTSTTTTTPSPPIVPPDNVPSDGKHGFGPIDTAGFDATTTPAFTEVAVPADSTEEPEVTTPTFTEIPVSADAMPAAKEMPSADEQDEDLKPFHRSDHVGTGHEVAQPSHSSDHIGTHQDIPQPHHSSDHEGTGHNVPDEDEDEPEPHHSSSHEGTGQGGSQPHHSSSHEGTGQGGSQPHHSSNHVGTNENPDEAD